MAAIAEKRSLTRNLNNSDAAGARSSLDLPLELILQIIEYVQIIDDDKGVPTTLVSLSQVNRAFHELVVDKIYEIYDDRRYTAAEFERLTLLYLRTMLESPHIAAKVRTHKSNWDYTGHKISSSPRQLLKDKITANVSGLQVPKLMQWLVSEIMGHLGCESIESLRAVMLMCTKNITHLEVINDGSEVLFWPGKVFLRSDPLTWSPALNV